MPFVFTMTQTCSRCGSHIPEGHAICPTCGAPVPKSAKFVRCSHCLHRVPAGLAVCPHCGRELKPWRPDKWILLFGVIVLLALWLFLGNGVQVLGKTGSALTSLLPPRMTPVTQDVAVAPTATPAHVESTIVIPTPTIAITQTVTLAPTQVLTPTVPATDTPAPEVSLTDEATATPTEAPTATPTPTATATATPKPQSNVYVVKAGDTLIGIAQKVDRDMDALASYNKISDPTTIFVGQKLKIPPANYVPPTPTPKRPTKTPTPKPTATPSITLAAPALVGPGDNAAYNGQKALIDLAWKPVAGVGAGDEYVVHIGVQVGTDQVDWRLNEAVGHNTTFRVPEWLFGQAPQQYGRTYIWYIQVADVTHNGNQVKTIPISKPSEKRRFHWN